ncbi:MULTISPECIES: hypothetical protein [Mycolicibacterium]|jgi:hypothetical protein|uniref:Uncharacterized protein n=3 Tax=Mycolicibacterium TaxID=1866885 RepID=A0AAE4VGQ6_MYCFO|nr:MULTISPECIES: hypothetical protein [Mycolicibacterium]KLI04531.1 hypothetical protein AA982_29545 [Mycolicibacterium senegalense]KLO53825.1 hypothetical protein ABW05_22385 [Mycolicibacterium senegalense]KMV16363.1 hypothetical protein ACT17_20580 [Mycolicibacterium conceptionense]MDV7194318.1 hypothetical protein [Mycolicibacterium fortuitum]MDV7294263.1 hypothetical protein [Mycolicibacterium fortuitum]
MTRQIPKPIAVPLGWVIFGAINGVIYGGGWVLMQCDNAADAWRWARNEYHARRVGAKAEQWLKDGAR